MNKQALAFLTMFSLILMLSVYYVTLPSDSAVVMKEEGSTQKEKQTSTKETDTSKENEAQEETTKKKTTSQVNEASDLQGQIDQKKEEEINKSSAVISDKDANESSKKKALATMEVLKDEKGMQLSVVQALQKLGYTAAVEIHDSTCIVTIFDQKDDESVAKKIMLEVSKTTNQKYFVEVAFK